MTELVPIEERNDYQLAAKLGWTVDRVRIERAIMHMDIGHFLEKHDIPVPEDPTERSQVYRDFAEGTRWLESDK